MELMEIPKSTEMSGPIGHTAKSVKIRSTPKHEHVFTGNFRIEKDLEQGMIVGEQFDSEGKKLSRHIFYFPHIWSISINY